jgi:2-iminobutanoate/2-iminopropanoate deaminase
MITRTVIATSKGPSAIGPYSQAIRAGNMIFVSGQIPLDPASDRLIGDLSVTAQARQCLENLKGILEGARASMGDVVKVTIYLTDMNDFKDVNAVYGTYFQTDPPARATVQVAGLPLGVAVEMDCIAVVEEDR